MNKPVRLLQSCAELQAELQRWRQSTPAAPLHFVPTMGALHAGHQSLIRAAGATHSGPAPRVLVSVFVNPLQFGAGEDFDRYPRTLEADAALAATAGADALFAPSLADLYPAGEQELTRDRKSTRLNSSHSSVSRMPSSA